MVSKRSDLTRTYASAITKKADEGVPYETVLKDGAPPEQLLPEEADVVVLGNTLMFILYFVEVREIYFLYIFLLIEIGGGSIGCNTLYHLTKLGIKNAALLERNRLTSGTTWHTGFKKLVFILNNSIILFLNLFLLSENSWIGLEVKHLNLIVSYTY